MSKTSGVSNRRRTGFIKLRYEEFGLNHNAGNDEGRYAKISDCQGHRGRYNTSTMPTQRQGTLRVRGSGAPVSPEGQLQQGGGGSQIRRERRRRWSLGIRLRAGRFCVEAARPAGSALLVVLPTIQEVDDFALDVANFSGLTPTIFPAWESLPQEHNVSDVVFGARLRVLRSLESANPPPVVITSITALLQSVPPQSERLAGTRTLTVGQEIDPEDLLDWLIDRGFDRVPALEAPGEFSMHGGIVDLFPPDALDPIRIEFFGDEIESLRTFDVESQRKLDDLNQITLTLLTPSQGSGEDRKRERKGDGEKKKTNGPQATDHGLQTTDESESLLASLPGGSWVGLVELAAVDRSGAGVLGAVGASAGIVFRRRSDRGVCGVSDRHALRVGSGHRRNDLPIAGGVHRTLHRASARSSARTRRRRRPG